MISEQKHMYGKAMYGSRTFIPKNTNSSFPFFLLHSIIFKRNYYRPKPDVYKAHIRIIVIHPPIEKHLVVLTN